MAVLERNEMAGRDPGRERAHLAKAEAPATLVSMAHEPGLHVCKRHGYEFQLGTLWWISEEGVPF